MSDCPKNACPQHSERVLLVEDDGLIRDLLLKTLSQGSYNLHLDWASNIRNASNYLCTTPPFFLILDLHLPDGSGLDLIPIAKDANPAIKIMAMTGQNSVQLVREVISMEVNAFVEKSESYATWQIAIKEVLAGRRYFSPATLERLIKSRVESGAEISQLTSREMEILKLTGMGYSLRETAEHLRISEHTVKVHRQNIMKKLHLRDAVGLARFAIAKGISSAD